MRQVTAVRDALAGMVARRLERLINANFAKLMHDCEVHISIWFQPKRKEDPDGSS